ncbi:hypothetical protein A2U01_0045244, partial [Trifolium medium]|nr:hypothetical protein [Trifolium medium]
TKPPPWIAQLRTLAGLQPTLFIR